jgi:acyl-CoA reductase-like NAD-dependent aldehyde dehydrogenase
MLHIPILRAGKPYKSLNTVKVKDFRSNKTVAELSQANSGLIRKDFQRTGESQRHLQTMSSGELIDICKKAAALFMQADLPLDGERQSADEYVRMLSLTTGMPKILCRNNMEKIHKVLFEMEAVIGGLTRGLDASILDKGWGTQDGRNLSFQVQSNTLGAILPNNSPGVHTLWLPSLPLKVPLMLKPGSQEPWTPYRVIQAFIQAGAPEDAFGYYPTDHGGATELLLRSGRSMLFGDASTVRVWGKDTRVQLHGPGWSKIVIAEDEIESWEKYLDVMVVSILSNSGRSCLNASGVKARPGQGTLDG